MNANTAKVDTVKLSINDIKSQFGINFDESFDTNLVVRGKSPIDKPILANMTITLEVYV